jgi:hypothetical protein
MQSTMSRRRRPGAGLAVGLGGTSGTTSLSSVGFDSSLDIGAILLLARYDKFPGKKSKASAHQAAKPPSKGTGDDRNFIL